MILIPAAMVPLTCNEDLVDIAVGKGTGSPGLRPDLTRTPPTRVDPYADKSAMVTLNTDDMTPVGSRLRRARSQNGGVIRLIGEGRD